MGYDDPWEKSLEPHGSLEALGPNLWWVWAKMASPPLPRNMVVARLADGGLLLHSPICLDAAGMAALEALGPIRWLLVPNEGHRSDIKRYKLRYPSAQVIAPKNAIPKVEEVVPVEASCEDVLPPLGVEVWVPDGMKPGYELVYLVNLDGGGRAALINDVLAAPHPHAATGLKGAMMKMLGPPGGGVGQARIVRFFFGKDPRQFRGFVERLAAVTDLRVVTTSHGAPLTHDVANVLRAAAARL